MSYRGRELTAGNYLKLDDIQSQFNGSTTTFNLTSGGTAFYPGSAFSIQVVLGGVIQEPESAYVINQSQITFAAAPGSVDDFFCIALGVSLGIGVPGEGTVTGTKLSKPFSYDDGLLVLDSTNNFIGVNSTTPTVALDIIGNVKVVGIITATSFSGTASSTTNIPNLSGAITSNNTTTSLGSFSSANLLAALTDKTGIGSAVFATSPTLVTPALGAATATSLVVSGVSTLGTVVVGGGTTQLIVTGNARITGILTVGTSSITLDGSNNQINVGTGVTLSSSAINVTGIITATSIVVSAGTTSLPSISPSGDSNTGIFFPAADTIAVSIGGTQELKINSKQFLSFGTSISPTNDPICISGSILQKSYGNLSAVTGLTTSFDIFNTYKIDAKPTKTNSSGIAEISTTNRGENQYNYVRRNFSTSDTDNGAFNQNICEIDCSGSSFNQIFVSIVWFTRIQGVSDGTCQPNLRTYGANKFNTDSGAFTITVGITSVNATSVSHMDIELIDKGSGVLAIQYQQSASVTLSSFIGGYIELICTAQLFGTSDQIVKWNI